MHWYDREEANIEKDYEEGYLTEKERREAMRDLNDELQCAKEEAAQQAFDSYGY